MIEKILSLEKGEREIIYIQENTRNREQKENPIDPINANKTDRKAVSREAGARAREPRERKTEMSTRRRPPKGEGGESGNGEITQREKRHGNEREGHSVI